MPLLRLWAARVPGLRRSLLLLLELLLAALSARSAWILLHNRHYFDDHSPASFVWLLGLDAQEWRWGALVAVGALLSLIGLLLLLARSTLADDVSFLLRQAGWACTATFWGSLGVSLLVWNPDMLSTWLTVSVAAIHVGMMVRGPWSWREGDGS